MKLNLKITIRKNINHMSKPPSEIDNFLKICSFHDMETVFSTHISKYKNVSRNEHLA